MDILFLFQGEQLLWGWVKIIMLYQCGMYGAP